jgi:hypothetical protein
MIPVTQTKVVVENSKGEVVQRGNCFAACIASILEVPITEVPNVEVFYHLDNGYHTEVMLTFLSSKGWDLCSDDTLKVFHDDRYGVELGKRVEWLAKHRNKYYLVSGKSTRGVSHICIYQNGKLVHDPHPTKEGLQTLDYFQTLEKLGL